MKRVRAVVFLLVLSAIGAVWYFTRPEPVVAPEISRYALEWPLPHHDYGNSRSNPDSAINTATVSNLQPLWFFALPAGASTGVLTGNAIIQGGRVYCRDGQSNVYALALDSGKLLWKKEYQQPASSSGGLSVARNLVYVSKGDNGVAALDLKGREKWSVQLTFKPGGVIRSQPIEYDGQVYVASSAPRSGNGSSPEDFGSIYALDGKNGEVKWMYNLGEEALPRSDLPWRSGEFGMFPAIDATGGGMFWPTALSGPWPPPAQVSEKNLPAELFQQRIAAFNHASGQLLWLQSLRNHDYINLDLQQPPIIASMDNRSIILAAGKGGWVYAVELVSGKPLWEVAVGEHQNDQLSSPPRGAARVLPGPRGGVASPMACRDGVLYIPVVNQAGTYSPGKSETTVADLSQGGGELLAIDIRYGKVLWRQTFDSAVLGGATIMGDLVFTSTYAGRVYAFNRISGEKIWEHQTDGRITGWPAGAGKIIVFPVDKSGAGPLLEAFSLP
ncbi:MAG: PQQ-binding-like beta-propeller repeat protein [Syntrophomonadaceae bacterium]